MATIYKRTRKAPIPTGAEIIERRGERFAVWTIGKRKRRALLTPDGGAVLLESAGYTIEYYDHNGARKRKSTRCTDREAMEQLARDFEKKAMFRREGYIDTRRR